MGNRAPQLPAGSVVEYCGNRATVIEDFGDTVRVDSCGFTETWRWVAEGVECKVISVADPIQNE